MNRLALDLIGWTATATFAASYFVKDATRLRRIQAVAAVIWIGYGLAIASAPLIGSNLLVAALALYSSRRRSSGPKPDGAV
ncbi:MAG: hypothetical protein KJZ84_17500 [Bryobacteraceae bacterium]|nr:hypothetical protein [Bryobacteraceae bacterium]